MTPHHTLAPTTDRTVPGAAQPPTREFPPHGPTLQQHVGHGLRPWLMLLAQFGRFARWASRFMARPVMASPPRHTPCASGHTPWDCPPSRRQRLRDALHPAALRARSASSLWRRTVAGSSHEYREHPSPVPWRCLPRRPGGGAVSPAHHGVRHGFHRRPVAAAHSPCLSRPPERMWTDAACSRPPPRRDPAHDPARGPLDQHPR